MAKGISIGVAADTRSFSQEVKNGVLKPLEGVEDALKDVAKDGDKAGDQLEDALKGSQSETQKLDKSQKELADTIRKSGKAGKDSGTDFKEGTDKAKEGIDEVGREAQSTAKESAASFDGSAESIGQAFQEVAANAFAGFGPAGMLAGVAAAAGIGVVFSKMEEGTEKTAAFKERVGELTQELIDSGDQAGPSLDYIVDRLKDLASETDDAETSLQDLYDVSKKSGSSFEDLAQAYAGNVDGLKDLQKAGEKRLEDLEAEADAIDQTAEASEGKYGALLKEAEGQQEYNKYLADAAKLAEEAAAQEEHYAQSGAAAMEARAEAVGTIQAELDGAMGLYDEFAATEETAIDPAGYIAAMQARIDATANFSSNVGMLSEKFGLTTDEVQALLDQGVDFGPMLQSIIDSGLDAEFIAKMQAAVAGGEDVLSGAKLDTTVDVDADTDKATDKIDAETEKDRDTEIKVKADTKDATTKVDAFTSKSRSATVSIDLDTAAADRALKSWMGKSRTITIKAVARDANGREVI